MNKNFRIPGKKLTVAVYVVIAVILISIISVMIVALAAQKRKNPLTPHDPPADKSDGSAGRDADGGLNKSDGKDGKSDDGNGNSGNNGNNGNKMTDSEKDGGKTESNPEGNTESKAGDTETGENAGNDDPGEPVSAVWSLPVAGYVSKAHADDKLVYSLTLGDYRVHKGIDIPAELGSRVCACREGVIENVYYDHMLGYCVSVRHDDRTVSYYMNLGSERPEGLTEGKRIGSGELIGYVGESAITEVADEPHLHFELKIDGKSCDPCEYLGYGVEASDFEG